MNNFSNTNRINEFIDAIMKVASGDFSVQLGISNENNELDALAREINIMVDDLRNSRANEYENDWVNSLNAQLKIAKEKVEESEERLRFSLEGANDGIWDVNMITNEVYISPRGCEILGYSPTEMSENVKIWSDLVCPDDLQQTKEMLQQYLSGNKPIFEIEQRLKTKSGEWKWVLVRGKVTVKDNLGNPLRMTGTHTDISSRKADELIKIQNQQLLLQQNEEYQQINEELYKAKEQAEENERMLKSIYNTVGDVIFHLAVEGDGRYRFVSVNKAFCNVTGLPEDNVVGKLVNEVIPEPSLSLVLEKYKTAIAERTMLIWEETSDYPTGRLVGEVRIAPVIDNTGYCSYLVGSVHDITDRKRVENELIKSKELAEESDRLKTAFLQNMSHEIRTPMNAIMGFSSLLFAYANDKTKLKEFTEIINQRCNDLLDIINDILDISKIESGQLSVHLEETNLSELFTELNSFFSEYQSRIDKQQIKFNLQALCEQNVVLTDKVKLKQIFINLISNAFKFTDAGRIEYGCKLNGEHKLLFYVSDTGVGIPSDKQQFVFERFTQLHDNTKKNMGGTGLGLPIVKALVGLLGGQVFIESEPLKGSTFSFTIPYRPALTLSHKPSIVENIITENFIGKTILIVEDDPYNAEYIKEVLSGIGLKILQAFNGEEAVVKSISYSIDLILMDIRLPNMDGYEAIRQIKQHKPYLKIIAQTAYAAQDEKEKAFKAGCVDYISKPTKREVLLSMLNKHLKGEKTKALF